MKISQALNIILIQTSLWYVPVVRCEKGQMDSSAAAAAAAVAEGNNDNDNDMERDLRRSRGRGRGQYPYRRNYVAVIEPDNFVTLGGSGGGITAAIQSSAFFGVEGGSIIEFGNVYDPADLALVNKIDGVEIGDPFLPSGTLADPIIGLRYAGDRQPKSPVPPGDKSYFFHGECVALSVSSTSIDQAGSGTPGFNALIGSITQTSHTCNLNLCLGGGGFDCIAIYAGTAYVFNFGDQIGVVGSKTADVSLPPPFPATIIGGTGSFEGIEGTVDIATICGTTGALINVNPKLGPFKVGYIVQTIKVQSNMPLPVAP
jgi:hypothetical protein